ncbi:hypothetical protein, partial [Salmonella sp. s51228]|uniref:hypothetical protein n=1 Tax=Salmonella sp. s51228 TaxID=3159652 RepID=UPI003980E8BB
QFEVYGCEVTAEQAFRKLFEYSTPKLVERGDPTYTGVCGENWCEGGIGMLTDGSFEVKSNGDDFIQMNFESSQYNDTIDINIKFYKAVYVSQMLIFGITQSSNTDWVKPNDIKLFVNGKISGGSRHVIGHDVYKFSAKVYLTTSQL